MSHHSCSLPSHPALIRISVHHHNGTAERTAGAWVRDHQVGSSQRHDRLAAARVRRGRCIGSPLKVLSRRTCSCDQRFSISDRPPKRPFFCLLGMEYSVGVPGSLTLLRTAPDLGHYIVRRQVPGAKERTGKPLMVLQNHDRSHGKRCLLGVRTSRRPPRGVSGSPAWFG